MEYPVTDWHGNRNVGCPFCAFATVTEGADGIVDQHVASVHPTQLREAAAAEMGAEIAAAREVMTKPQLLELAEGMGIDGLTTRSSRDEITAAIAAAEEQAVTALTVGAETQPAAAASTAPKEDE